MDAPRASIDFAPQPVRDGTLSPYNQVDLIVGPEGFNLPGRSRKLFTDEFVLISDPGNKALSGPEPSLADLSSVPHAVAYLNDPVNDDVQEMLRRAGVDYSVGARLFGLAALPTLISGTDMVALVPRMLAAKASRTLQLSVFELPAGMNLPMTECVYWHPRDEDDLAMKWLRDALARTVSSLSPEMSGPPPKILRGSEAWSK
ncbi:LysR substrate-binding domain-containing protein [Neomicrococcus lactis]